MYHSISINCIDYSVLVLMFSVINSRFVSAKTRKGVFKKTFEIIVNRRCNMHLLTLANRDENRALNGFGINIF